MLGYVSGKFICAEENSVLVDVNGVGYQVLVSARLAAGLVQGTSITLFVHTHLRENALELFGFQDALEKRVFLLLTSVSGVGPRTALAILNGLDSQTILNAIIQEDKATLSSAPGVGKKTAERLIIELSTKAAKMMESEPAIYQQNKVAPKTFVRSPKLDEVIAALLSLGYQEAQARQALKQMGEMAELESAPVEKLVMRSLQLLSRGANA